MRVFYSFVCVLALMGSAHAATDARHPKQEQWRFDGVFGTYDKPSIQRGFQVYREVCSSCHSMKRLPFRKLTEAGFSADEVKSLAAEYTVVDGPNDEGEMFERPGRPSDSIPSPYANEQAARAVNNGAYPLDLSLITKARHDGPNYIYSLLTGYEPAPAYRCSKHKGEACVKFKRISAQQAKAMEAALAEVNADKDATAASQQDTPTATAEPVYYCASIAHNEDGSDSCNPMGKTLHYNPYFPGMQIAMVAPLHTAGQVEYQDKTEASVEQMARDVVNFLQWVAEPEMEVRKRTGIKVMLFLIGFTVFFYVAKKRIWARVDH